MQPAEETPIRVTPTVKFLIAILSAGILALGIYPAPVLAALK
jgi:hypothetical protein